jgi:uncharacterized protein YggE
MRKLFSLMFLLGTISAFADDVRLISVTGSVEKSFQPDIVRINISLWGKGDSAKKAQVNNQSVYEVFKKSLETFKVKKEDVKTTSYNLNPEYVFDPKTNKNNISGYSATQELQVTLRKIDDAGYFVDSLMSSSKAMTSGASVNSLGFDIDKRADEERALLGDAVRAAEEQAKVLAMAAKIKLKGIYRLAPRSNNSPVQMFQTDALMALPREKAAATTFMSGEVKVESIVSAEYLIE